MRLLIDVNVLLALTLERSRQHVAAGQWLARQPAEERLEICRPVQMGYLRLLCTEAVMSDEALTLPQAWGMYARLLASGRFAFAVEPLRLDATWAELCRPFARSPKVVMDAYLAAFATASPSRLLTLDQAFGKFPGLDWRLVG